jgi:beta-lactam-binding protein with PASTA domain
MSLKEYLKSKVFAVQVFVALLILFVLGYLFMHWLTFTTDHGNEITVPNLAKMTEEQVEETVDDLDLDYVLLDSVDFNPAFPKHTVVEQDPMPGAKVKKNRKIYIKINSSGFNMVRIPNLIQKTYRQAVPTLKSLGLEPGEITYKPDFAEVVLEMYCNGKKLNPGDKIFKSSKIDLVIGDGSGVFEEEIDSLSTETTPNEQ